MHYEIYDHRNGKEILSDTIVSEIKEIINVSDVSKITDYRAKVLDNFKIAGWSGEFRLHPISKLTVTAFRNKIGLCLQTGNVARVYADLLKLQTLYVKGNIKCGVIILPTKELTKKLNALNMANFERLKRELPVFINVITMPLIIIGINYKEW